MVHDDRVIADRYTLVRELGRGGMGAVWLARDEVLGRSVAVKRLPLGAPSSVQSSARAWREARLAAGLSDPHLVTVFDVLIDDDELWLVMEYVDGPSLARLVRERGPMSPAQAAAVIDDVAAGLVAAHAAGVVHRDVKPSNILIPGDGPAKLGDFGIARGDGAEQTLTMTGAVTGSPAYLAPEVVSGSGATVASDVWSLGATLFHVLTGRPPYEDDSGNVLGVLYRIVHDPVPTTDRAGWLAPLLAGTMAPDPRQRWSLAQVRRFLADAPVVDAPAAAIGAPVAGAAAIGTPMIVAAHAAAPGGEGDPATAVLPMTAVPSPQDAATSDRRNRGAGWVVAAAVAATVVAIVVVAVSLAHRGSGGAPAAHRVNAHVATRSTAPRPSAPPSATASATAHARSAGPSATDVRAFVQTYLATAPRDQEAAFAMLTPRYQAESGGLAGYRSFWGEVTHIHAVTGLQASVAPLQATYTYTYTRRHVGTVTQRVRLDLVYADGRILIDNGTVVGR